VQISSSGSDRRFLIATVVVFALLTIQLLRTAWVSDDAYITFRVSDNVVNGLGAVWNTSERVQGYTHPLWFGVFTAFYALTRDAYYTCIALGIVLTLGACAFLRRRIADQPWPFLVAAAALLSSKAFLDFSTSGLENPLSHLLILMFLWCWWRCADERRTLRLSLIASLCVLNRIDLVLLVGPAILVDVMRRGWRESWRPLLVGLTPLIAWEMFSVWYYASLVPNTAFAKLNISMDLEEAVRRGYWYVRRTALADPATLPVMLAAVAITAHSHWKRDWPLIGGLLASVLYLFWIGGDFMAGRFFSVPLVWSAAIVAASPVVRTRRAAAPLIAGIVVAGLLAPWEPALLSGYGYTPFDNFIRGRDDRGPRDNGLLITQHEITDTRRYYFEGNALLKGKLGDLRPDNPGVGDGLELRARGRQVVTRYAIGFTGYFAGPDVHIVDVLALTDPLLARLPSIPGSRVGHYQRDIPAGYLESLQSGRNVIVDADLAEYYGRMQFAMAGPLFDARRSMTAVAFAFGRFDAARKRYIRKTWAGR